MSSAQTVEQLAPEHIERALPGTRPWLSLHADHLARYFHAASFVTGQRVLDAGTGPGYGAAILKAAGAREVQAIDIDEATIRKARASYPVEGVEYLVDDCETLARVPGQFDVICNFENIEHLRKPEAFLQVAADRLVDEGVLLCSSPDRAATNATYVGDRPPNPFHEREWYADEFRELMRRYFRNVQLFRQVESIAIIQRREAVKHLQGHLSYLWSNPVARIGRAFAKVFGRSRPWQDVSGLATPAVADYPIVHESIAGCVGAPWCLFAVCREPVR